MHAHDIIGGQPEPVFREFRFPLNHGSGRSATAVPLTPSSRILKRVSRKNLGSCLFLRRRSMFWLMRERRAADGAWERLHLRTRLPLTGLEVLK